MKNYSIAKSFVHLRQTFNAFPYYLSFTKNPGEDINTQIHKNFHFSASTCDQKLKNMQLIWNEQLSFLSAQFIFYVCHAALILILFKEEEELGTTWKHSHYCSGFITTTLDSYRKSIRINKIPRFGLLNVDKSVWRYLYDANNDPGLIPFTGINHLHILNAEIYLHLILIYTHHFLPMESLNQKFSSRM